jgi:hypothetical protein
MAIRVPNVFHQHKTWFYFRKAFFQMFLPVLVTFLALIGAANGKGYYFFFAFTLFIYGAMRAVLDFIFDTCSDEMIFKKEINLEGTVSNLMMSANMESGYGDNMLTVIKKIYKLRYSDSGFFKFIDKMCWFMGLDGPILIPFDIVKQMTNVRDVPTAENEFNVLKMTVHNIYTYQPTEYVSSDSLQDPYPLNTSLLRPATLDQSINHVKKELFG